MEKKSNGRSMLRRLSLPGDLKKLSIPQCRALCAEIRRKLISTVEKNGGHLSSNLGTVELTVSLHRIFDSPDDKIIWDVGHQSYTHKLLTGRLKDFDKIRRADGISGFCRPSESPHDAFISGHSSTAVSAACGIGRAMHLNGDTVHRAIAVVGDGAFTGGECFEGLNNAGKGFDNVIVVLNDNEMSISKSVGAVAKYLTSIRGNEKYIAVKQRTGKFLDTIPTLGQPVKEFLKMTTSTMRWLLYRNTMFENMGFVYLGPVDGHDIAAMDEVFKAAKIIEKPVLVHVKTVKGKGFAPAEKNPGAFHGVGALELKYGNPEVISDDCFSAAAGHELNRLGSKDKRICAVTAAMKYGTGLQFFAADHPERFFDVGIAEAHAVTFCGGLASMGKIPVFAVYSSFLQRSYDQLVHDIAIPNEHIVLCIDRAGIVGEDGETHQGIFDVPMLTSIPNTTIYSPWDYTSLKACIDKAIYDTGGIAAVRYPKGKGKDSTDGSACTDYLYEDKYNSDILAVTYGRLSASLLSDKIECDKLCLVKIFPLEADIAAICRKYKYILFFEEGSGTGGIGEHLSSLLSEEKGIKIRHYAINSFVPQSSVKYALHMRGLDEEGMGVAVSLAKEELLCET